MDSPKPKQPGVTRRKTMLAITLLGGLLLCYGLWALYSGEVISTWGQTAYRPSVIYWITVVAFIVMGGANAIMGVILLFR